MQIVVRSCQFFIPRWPNVIEIDRTGKYVVAEMPTRNQIEPDQHIRFGWMTKLTSPNMSKVSRWWGGGGGGISTTNSLAFQPYIYDLSFNRYCVRFLILGLKIYMHIIYYSELKINDHTKYHNKRLFAGNWVHFKYSTRYCLKNDSEHLL